MPKCVMVAVAGHNESMRYVALLRAINVGTANRVKMADLLAAINANGVVGATTYLQSGNILFSWTMPASRAEKSFASALAQLGLKSTPVIRSASQIAEIAAREPFKGRPEPEKSQFVTYLTVPLDDDLPAGEASEILLRTPTEIYWVATPREGKAPTGPKLPKDVIAQSTNRNWIVTRALADLLRRS